MRCSSLSDSSNSFISSFCVAQAKGKHRKVCSIPSPFAMQSFQFTLTNKSEREARSLCHQYLENSDVTASVTKHNFRFRVSSALFLLTTNADVTKSRDKGYNAQTHRFPLVAKEVDHTGQSLFRLHVYPNPWVLRNILHLKREDHILSCHQYGQKLVRRNPINF